MQRKGSNNTGDELKLAPGEVLWPEHVVIDGTSYSPDDLAGTLDAIASWTHSTTQEKGFYDPECEVTEEKLLLMVVGEVSEVTEALREGNPPSEKIPGYSKVEEECADAILRILCYAKEFGHDVVPALISKAFYNDGRPHRHGGKKF